MKNIEEFSGKSLEERTSRQKKREVIGLGRRTREEIAKWKMTALRFQTGGDIRHPRPPFRGPVKKAQRLGHAGTIDPSVEFINTKYRKKGKMEWTEFIYIYIYIYRLHIYM